MGAAEHHLTFPRTVLSDSNLATRQRKQSQRPNSDGKIFKSLRKDNCLQKRILLLFIIIMLF